MARLDAAFVNVTVARKNIEANLADADALFQIRARSKLHTTRLLGHQNNGGNRQHIRPNEKQAIRGLRLTPTRYTFVLMEYLNIVVHQLVLRNQSGTVSWFIVPIAYVADGHVLLPTLTPRSEYGKLGIATLFALYDASD